MSTPLITPRGEIATLNGLRGLAIALVLVGHSSFCKLFPWMDPNVGVVVFFVLSGFLITRSLLGLKDSGGGLVRFYVSRAARIFPLFLLVGLVALVVIGPGPEMFAVFTYQFNSFMLTAGAKPTPWMSPMWSLCVEEHVYCLLPLLIWWVPRWLGGCIVTVWLGLALYHAGAVGMASFEAGSYFPQTFSTGVLNDYLRFASVPASAGMAAGSLLAFGESSLKAREWLVLGLGSVVGVYAVNILFARHFGSSAGSIAPLCDYYTRILWGVGLFSLAYYHHLAPGMGAVVGFLTDKTLGGLARVSYCVYLIHLPIYCLLGADHHSGPSLARALVALTLTLALAWLSDRFIETPAREWVKGKMKKAASGPLTAPQVNDVTPLPLGEAYPGAKP